MLGESEWEIGKNVRIGRNVRVEVSEYFSVGGHSVINDNVLIEGRRVEIGRGAWLAEHSSIGGGSCHSGNSMFRSGDFLHMGRYSHVNIADEVIVGHEVGIGRGTRIYTHGVYLSAWDGYPADFDGVFIGSNVWLPGAIVNPGVLIGSSVVVAAGSVVSRSLPEGCLAGGIPARVIEHGRYPKGLTFSDRERLMARIVNSSRAEGLVNLDFETGRIRLKEAVFDIPQRKIIGEGDGDTELLRDQLRRYGIRFRYSLTGGEYVPWD